MAASQHNQKSKTTFKSLIRQTVNKILSSSGFTITRTQKVSDPGILHNVFKTSYTRTALLSYIKPVFEEEANRYDRRHTNRYTTFLVGEAMSKAGYNVDVIHFDADFKGDFEKYDFIFGLGKVLDHVLQFRKAGSKTKVITFATGCNPFFSNVITTQRIGDFYKKHRKMLFSSSRYITEDWPLQHEFGDWIIVHGASFAKATYRKENISTIHAPVFIKHSVTRTDEEWVAAKNNYLWFGNGGAIHKGLDLVLDTFLELRDCRLQICGNIEHEREFFNYYQPLIHRSVNITYHGFVDVQSEDFAQVLKSCAFVIYPSASEGNSPSVITCMANGGLIPVISRNADLDLTDYGIYMDDVTVPAVLESVRRSQLLSLAELKEQSSRIMEETRRINSFDFFISDFEKKLQQAITAVS